jgi:cobalt-zinc-cadmium efflux system outer membrane protein
MAANRFLGRGLGRTGPPIVVLTCWTLSAGCSLTPPEFELERNLACTEGAAWSEQAELAATAPEPAVTSADQAVARAMVANGDLQAAWHQWRAALARVERAAAWPSTNLAAGTATDLGGSPLWDRTRLSIAFDAMENLSFPVKARKAGEQALAKAREAGARFVAQRLALRRKVLEAWTDLALAEERRRTAAATLELQRLAVAAAAARVAAGGEQSLDWQAEVATERAGDELARAEAASAAARVRLAAAFGGSAGDIVAPEGVEVRPWTFGDEGSRAAVLRDNPQIRASRHAVDAAAAAVELSRLAWVPDINPSLVLAGGSFEALAAVIVVPTTIPEIRAAIAEAEAEAEARRTTLFQEEDNLASELLAVLIERRDALRRRDLYLERILPRARSLASVRRAAWQAGRGELADVVAAEVLVEDSRWSAARAAADAEYALAALEELAGVTDETMSPQSTDVSTDAGNTDETSAAGARALSLEHHHD